MATLMLGAIHLAVAHLMVLAVDSLDLVGHVQAAGGVLAVRAAVAGA